MSQERKYNVQLGIWLDQYRVSQTQGSNKIIEIYLTETVKEEDKIQKIYSFPNGYGASVIKGKYTYGGDKGLWELAPWTNNTNEFIGMSMLNWEDDVIGNLHDPDVHAILGTISRLPSA